MIALAFLCAVAVVVFAVTSMNARSLLGVVIASILGLVALVLAFIALAVHELRRKR